MPNTIVPPDDDEAQVEWLQKQLEREWDENNQETRNNPNSHQPAVGVLPVGVNRLPRRRRVHPT